MRLRDENELRRLGCGMTKKSAHCACDRLHLLWCGQECVFRVDMELECHGNKHSYSVLNKFEIIHNRALKSMYGD